MPLLLDDIDLTDDQSAAPTLDPKFFSSKLTGNGKHKTGVLHQSFLPQADPNSSYLAPAESEVETKSGSMQHGITVTSIPFAPLRRSGLRDVSGTFSLASPHPSRRFSITTGSNDWEISFYLTPQAGVMFEDSSGSPNKMAREFIVQYRMELYFVPTGGNDPTRTPIVSGPFLAGTPEAHVRLDWDCSPIDHAADFVASELNRYQLVMTDVDALETWLRDDYSIYDGISEQAQIWGSDQMADEICSYIDGFSDDPSDQELNALALQLRYLENYSVPLEAYRTIHQKLAATFDESIARILAKQNLNLLMSHTLSHLDGMRDQLNTPSVPQTAPMVASHLSQQQREALTTHEPLVMTQAGAGTGKSTVILERIKYLQACGVQATDITVLSFTNAAADNITAKNSAVGSMTIARMINDIYALNHPDHELSSIDTIINSIDIFYPNSDFAAAFRRRLIQVDQNKTGAFTGLNAFVEAHYDAVIELLDRIKQTSLELEIIICYQRIDSMSEPAHVQAKYLIVDEVQDNSIFEFIYMLKYVSKHAQSLFIVGDASQTLYEFRSANPRALNTLEGSGVFATFRLTTNYRSNQEILDFANVALGGLETNQFANIRLQANSLTVPTADSFQEKVTVDYHPVSKLNTFINEELAGTIRVTLGPDYIDQCLARGEQVAFLAYSRREVAAMQAALEQRYPQRHVANLVSEKVFATDVFSKYIKFFWNDVLQVKPSNAAFVVTQGIKDNMHKLTRNASKKGVEQAVLRMVSNWWVENASVIRGWEVLCAQGGLSHREFFSRLRDNMLSFEIRHNAVRQSLTNQRNRDRKAKNSEAQADLVVSTIHGAKGMEFDNVVVLHKENPSMSQELKRMFYVAFTRAMNSMYVLSYGTVKNPPITSSYESIVNVLTERDNKAAARAAGVDPDLLSDQPGSDPKDPSASLSPA